MPPKNKGTKRKAAKTDKLEESTSKLPRADSEKIVIKRESSAPKSKAKVDKHMLEKFKKDEKPVIHEDFSCMLNQTNVVGVKNKHNNKFYKIQIAKVGETFHLLTRNGRDGDPNGSKRKKSCTSAEEAEKEFKKKFKQKTGNKWDNRTNFKEKAKQYTLLEMDDDDTVDNDVAGPSSKIKKETDVLEMPLEKLSKNEVAKGLEVLNALEEAVKESAEETTITKLTSQFYTHIPHKFSRHEQPKLLDILEISEKKRALESFLQPAHIAQAQTLKDVKEEKEDTEHQE